MSERVDVRGVEVRGVEVRRGGEVSRLVRDGVSRTEGRSKARVGARVLERRSDVTRRGDRSLLRGDERRGDDERVGDGDGRASERRVGVERLRLSTRRGAEVRVGVGLARGTERGARGTERWARGAERAPASPRRWAGAAGSRTTKARQARTR
ncbi:MAG: hypothetical protein AAF628_08580 [Planctomycetota bacterium]